MKSLVVRAAWAWTGVCVAQSAWAAPRYVDALANCHGLKPCYTTVVDAVAAARAADVIRIFPGVFRESVFIDSTKRNLILTANNPTQMAIIAAPDGSSDAITTDAAGLQVRNLVLEAPGSVVTSSGLATSVVVENSMIFGQLTFGGCQSLRILNNSILGSIHVTGPATTCTITGNAIMGGVAQPDGSFVTIELGAPGANVTTSVVHGNAVRGGGILFPSPSQIVRSRVELNWVEGGGIHLVATDVNDGNVVNGNFVRDGEIRLETGAGGITRGIVTANFTAGSPGDGIVLAAPAAGSTAVRNNTAVDAANCDINDTSPGGDRWTANVFRTPCGNATN